MKESIQITNSISFPFRDSCEPYSIRLEKGKYKFEAWGAAGGGEFGGHGAYAAGITTIFEPQLFFIYVGGRGENVSKSDTRPRGGCNGGGKGGLAANRAYYNGAGGGGSTDIRLEISNSTRILVAAGGGGMCGYGIHSNYPGGVGGDEKGGIASGLDTTEEERKIVPTLKSGYAKVTGQDGRDAQEFFHSGAEGNGGGGGGYYGGYAITATGNSTSAGGGGGSSFANTTIFKVYTLQAGDKMIYSPYRKLDQGNSDDGFFCISLIVFVTCQKSIYFTQKTLSLTLIVLSMS